MSHEANTHHMCCECINWEMGDTWQTNQNDSPGQPIVISEGWCCSPERKRPKAKWSHCPACQHFDAAPRMGFIMCGRGDITADVMNEVFKKIEELLKD